MVKHVVSLQDKFNLSEKRQILTGTQAVVRLLLMQKARDRKAGLNTGGYVTGYRGSPIATLEAALHGVEKTLKENDIRFQPGLNEDLSATAIWGTQQAELYGEGKYDGVFGLWYGKGPGVDRSGDVFRHANHAGTSRNGGVLALMGDDHTCESSTTAHQSEFAFVDAMMPILNPAGVQEILDFGILAYALSRYAGVWVGLKCVKDNIELTATVDGNPDRVSVKLPSDDEFAMPEGGLGIRAEEHALDKEARLFDYKIDAVRAFVRNNDINRIVTSGGPTAKIGIVSTGKSYLDVREALDNLGLDEVGCNEQGIRILKVGMPWPLEPGIVKKFAKDLDLIIVVEEKRALIETQIKEQLFNTDLRPVIIGKKNEHGNTLFQEKAALEATQIGIALGERLLSCDRGGETVSNAVAELKRLSGNKPATPEAFTRVPYFCAGCPHSIINQGARRLTRLRRHRLPLHGQVDGSRDLRLHPHGCRRRKLDRRSPLHHPQPRLPEPRRRHLYPLRFPRHPRSRRSRRQHHLQAALQRRSRHDRRPVPGWRLDRRHDGPAGARRRRQARRHRHRRTRQIRRRQRHPCQDQDPSSPRPDGGPKELGDNPRRHRYDLRPDLRVRKTPPPQARPVPGSRQARIH